MNSPALKKLASWVFLPIGGVFLSLLLAEGVLRIANISFPVFDAYDDLRGVALRPGKEGWYQKEGKAYLKINSLGYRDSEHAIAKPAGTYRIAVLGDSFAEARQVAQEDTFWSLLGRDLGSCSGLSGKKIEVLNFGIGSYGTTQELLTLRKDALRFSPDLVLLAFFPENDLQDNSKELSLAEQWRMPKPYYVHMNGSLVMDESFRQSRWRRFLYDGVNHSRVLELVNEARRAWAVKKAASSAGDTRDNPQQGVADGLYAPPTTAAWQEAWSITEDVLDQMNQEVTSSGARFAVTTISTPPQVFPDPAVRRQVEQRLGVADLFYADRRISEIGQKHGFPVIGLAQPLQKISTEKGIYLHGFKNSVMGEGHWNEAGHRQAANLLVDGLCANVLTTPAT